MSLFAPDMPWQAAAVLWLGTLLIAGGVIAFIVGLVQDEKARKRQLRQADYAVGRDVYREFTK